MTQQDWLGACERTMSAFINILGGKYDRSYNLHPRGRHTYYMNPGQKEYTKPGRGRQREAAFYRPRFEEISNAFDQALGPNTYVRPDCSGFVNAALQVVGAIPRGLEYSVNVYKRDIPGFFKAEPVQSRTREELKNEVLNSAPGTIFMHGHHCRVNAGGGMIYDFGNDRNTTKTNYWYSPCTHKLVPIYNGKPAEGMTNNAGQVPTLADNGSGEQDVNSSNFDQNQLNTSDGTNGNASPVNTIRDMVNGFKYIKGMTPNKLNEEKLRKAIAEEADKIIKNLMANI